MCCVNRSDSAVFPPELQPCSWQAVGMFAQARGRENEGKKEKGCPVHHHGYLVTDIVGRCYRVVAHVKLICFLILKPASSDLWQTSRFARLKKSWQPVVQRHSPSPAAPCSAGFCLFCSARVCNSFPCSLRFYGITWSRVCWFHHRRSCPVVFRSICSLVFSFLNYKSGK